MYPAILNLGPVELLVVGILLFVLFGADKLPEMARSLGRAQAEFNKTRKAFLNEMKSEEDRALEKQYEFELRREAHVKAHRQAELERLRQAAAALDIPTDGKNEDELRRDIAAAAGGPGTPPGATDSQPGTGAP